MGTSGMRLSGYITKKLARMDVQSTRRTEVMRASWVMPAMSKRNTSPSRKRKVLAMPSSMLRPCASSGVH